MRRPGKKGSPLRYTSTLFTVGCESHDAFVPGLAMPVAPCALRCPSRPHLFARERLLPGNPAGPDTAHAGNTGTPPGERSGLAGAGHSPAACARPCRLYTALYPVHGPEACYRALQPGHSGSSPATSALLWPPGELGAGNAKPGGKTQRDSTAETRTGGEPRPRGPLSSGSAMTGSPTALLSLGNFPPRVLGLPAGQPGGSLHGPEPPRQGGRGAACPETERGSRGGRGNGIRTRERGKPLLCLLLSHRRLLPRGKGRRRSCPGRGGSGNRPRRHSASAALWHTLGTRSRKT